MPLSKAPLNIQTMLGVKLDELFDGHLAALCRKFRSRVAT